MLPCLFAGGVKTEGRLYRLTKPVRPRVEAKRSKCRFFGQKGPIHAPTEGRIAVQLLSAQDKLSLVDFQRRQPFLCWLIRETIPHSKITKNWVSLREQVTPPHLRGFAASRLLRHSDRSDPCGNESNGLRKGRSACKNRRHMLAPFASQGLATVYIYIYMYVKESHAVWICTTRISAVKSGGSQFVLWLPLKKPVVSPLQTGPPK